MMQWDREAVAAAIVGTGGAWMLGSSMVHARSGRWNRAQLAGLRFAGAGFLMSAAAARWLQHTGRLGIAFSLVGTMFAMRGMYMLLRQRAVERAMKGEVSSPGSSGGPRPGNTSGGSDFRPPE